MDAIKKQATKLREQVAKQQQVLLVYMPKKMETFFTWRRLRACAVILRKVWFVILLLLVLQLRNFTFWDLWKGNVLVLWIFFWYLLLFDWFCSACLVVEYPDSIYVIVIVLSTVK